MLRRPAKLTFTVPDNCVTKRIPPGSRASSGHVGLVGLIASVAYKLPVMSPKIPSVFLQVLPPSLQLPFVLRVTGDQRKVFVGMDGDETCHGKKIADCLKSWKSCPIRSWAGGKKMAGGNRMDKDRYLNNCAIPAHWLHRQAWKLFVALCE